MSAERPRPGPHGTGRPQRVRVTSPRMGTPRAAPRSPAREIDEQTRIGEVYMRSLLRAQLRPAVAVITVMVLTLGTLPLLFAGRTDLPRCGWAGCR